MTFFFLQVPGIPMGLKAAYLSTSELEISWQPPERPNGIITSYVIVYKEKSYSFWNTKLDWCSRKMSTASSIKNTGNSNQNNGTNGNCIPVEFFLCSCLPFSFCTCCVLCQGSQGNQGNQGSQGSQGTYTKTKIVKEMSIQSDLF